MEDQKQRVYDALDKLKIKYEVVEHEPVHTMEDMDRLGLPEKGTLCKNLFLRDSKGKRHFLVRYRHTGGRWPHGHGQPSRNVSSH